MKGIQSVIFRALSFLLVGILMVSFPDKMTIWLVIIIGILFLIPGLVSIASFFKVYSKMDSMGILLPVIGVGSIFLGLLLILWPGKFIAALMYFLAVAIILAGVTTLVNIIHFKKYKEINFKFYILPILFCASGFFIIVNPIKAISAPFIIFGVAAIIYGLTELFYGIHFRKVYRKIYFEGQKVQKTEAISEHADSDFL